MPMSVEDRLREWAEYSGEEVSLTGPESVLWRLIHEAPSAAGSRSSVRGNGPVPALSRRISFHRLSRVREVTSAIRRMPTEYQQVIIMEWLNGLGYRRASAELEWSEKQWLHTRAAMLSWLSATLGLEAYIPRNLAVRPHTS